VSFDILLTLEWTGTLLALIGSFLLASHKFKPSTTLSFWLASNICYIAYFFVKEQNGLLLMNICGFIINLFGMYQWIQHEEKVNSKMATLLFNLSLMSFVATSFYVASFLISPSVKNVEWIGSTLGIAAAFLISSRHKYSFLCWFVWCASNFMLLVMAIITKQYGFLFLQIGFMFINVYGTINWIKQYRLSHTIESNNMELPSKTL
jgi:hypothetical protein